MKLRALISLVLTLALVLTGHGMASARGVATPVGSVVLCIGGTAVVVTVDADGQPVEAPHFCPDCTLQVVPTNVATTITAQRVVRPVERTRTLPSLALPLKRTRLPLSRGPPALV